MGGRAERLLQSNKKFEVLCSALGEAETILRDSGCVYATGSFGRREASGFSDLDIFIVSKIKADAKTGDIERLLPRLDTIRVKAHLIIETRKLAFPEFSGDGRWLLDYTVSELTETLGKPDDDALNTFTARLLLLLESRPLLEVGVYKEVVDDVRDAYCKDYDDHKDSFVPAFLVNDILRLWRTLCVNYEANTSNTPAEKLAKRKLKNYKLKHSRLLTCYSALLYLLALFDKYNTVHPDQISEMTILTPTERLDWIHRRPEQSKAHTSIAKLLEQYEQFLVQTNAEESALVSLFQDPSQAKRLMKTANELGNTMFEAVRTIGNGNRLHRVLVV